jgi:hypothetical protein
MSSGRSIGTIVGAVVGVIAAVVFTWGAAVPAVLAAASAGLSAGAAAGGMIGSSFDVNRSYGPRTDNLQVQSSTYGAPIYKLYGTGRLAGNVVWATDIIETENTEESSGKGGPTNVATTYSYSANLMIGVCEGPIIGIRRIWADTVLIYSADGNRVGSLLASNKAAADDGFRIRIGDDTHTASSYIESIEGVDTVPGFRGLATVQVRDFQLADYGNRIPNFTAEVVAGSATLDETLRAFVDEAHNLGFAEGADWVTYAEGVIRAHYPTAAASSRISDGAGNISGSAARYRWKAADGASLATKNSDYDDNLPGYSYTASYIVGSVGDFQVAVDYVSNASSNYPTGSDRGGVRTLKSSGRTKELLPGIYYTAQSGERQLVAAVCSNNASRLYVFSVLNTAGTFSDFRLDVYAASLNSRGSYTFGANPISGTNDWFARSPRDGKCMAIHEGSDRLYVYDAGVVSLYAINADYSLTLLKSDTFTAYDYPMGCIGAGAFFVISQNRITLYSDHQTLTNNPVPLADIITDICADAGLSASDIDVSGISDTVDGYVIDRPMSARDALTPLLQAFQIDIVESDWTLKFIKRGDGAAVAVTEDDLGAAEASDSSEPSGEKVVSVRAQELDLPRRLTTKFLSKKRLYEPMIQPAGRSATQANLEAMLDWPIVMTADAGKQKAEILLAAAWRERTRRQLTLPASYIGVDPGDILTVPADGAIYTVLVIRSEYAGGVIKIEGVEFASTDYVSTATGDEPDEPSQDIAMEGPTEAVYLDIPTLRDEDDGAGMYIALSGELGDWRGCQLYQSVDGGQSYRGLLVSATDAVTGRATTVLASGPTTVWDKGNTITIETDGSLSSTTEILVYNGGNLAALGAHGRWEIIQFKTATLNIDGTYTLSELLRGRYGTEHSVGNHAVGDTFVLLTESTVLRLAQSSSDLNREYLYAPVSVGTALENTETDTFTNTGVSLKPLSPVQIRATRNAAGDIVLAWVRRARTNAEWNDYVDVPLDEDSESYSVDILNGSTVMRTVTASTATITYTAAQQTTDFGSPQASVSVAVYQVSALAGRGYAGTATV